MKFEATLIITTYNQPEFLEYTLASVQNQTVKNFETLIADDGSTNQTKSIIQNYQKTIPQLIHVWHEDSGYRKSLILNKTIQKSSTEYLVFIDGDCILHKDFMYYHQTYKKAHCFLAGRRVELGPLFTKTISTEKILQGYLDGFNVKLWRSCRAKDSRYFHRSIPIQWNFLRKLCHWDTVPDILGSNFSLFKKDLIDCNGFNEDLNHYWGEDGDLFIRLRNRGLQITSLKNLAVQYHLYHTRREPDKKIMEWYYTNVKNNFHYTRCSHGIEK